MASAVWNGVNTINDRTGLKLLDFFVKNEAIFTHFQEEDSN